LLQLYVKHGLYRESLVSLTKKGLNGAAEIKQMMVQLRENPPSTVHGSNIIKIEDYLTSQAINKITGKVTPIDMPKSDVLIYYSEAGDKIAARPSGTEPKIKFYVSAKGKVNSMENVPLVSAQLDARIAAILNEMNII
jgi:phosphomannomutase